MGAPLCNCPFEVGSGIQWHVQGRTRDSSSVLSQCGDERSEQKPDGEQPRTDRAGEGECDLRTYKAHDEDAPCSDEPADEPTPFLSSDGGGDGVGTAFGQNSGYPNPKVRELN